MVFASPPEDDVDWADVAPGAAGNLATEDLVYMLDGLGVKTGVDLGLLIEAGRVAETVVGRHLPGKVHQAGPRVLRLA